jgi:hypothetical protein
MIRPGHPLTGARIVLLAGLLMACLAVAGLAWLLG